jgi:hypothetical protein
MTLVHNRGHILSDVSPTARGFPWTKVELAEIYIMVLETRTEPATAGGVELQDGRMIRDATAGVIRTLMCGSAVNSHVSGPMSI